MARLAINCRKPLTQGEFNDGAGQVGIFWRIAVAGGYRPLIDSVPVKQGEPYGEFQAYGGHQEFWCRLAGPAAAQLRKSGIPEAVRWSEYEEWPRGRIVFHIPSGRVMLYADRKRRKVDIISEIMGRFPLAADQTDVRGDPHYVNVR
ncbi:MAG TPA: hypothetical protein PLD10_24170 [Rhodopila sp.]|nr:hypothetical protein [Rhodopila sp.]